MIDLERILIDYENKHYHLKNPRQVKSGKEATVFVVFLDDKPVALKIYTNPDFRSFQNNQIYLEGKYFKKPSERKAVLKRNKFGRGLLHKNWIKREFYLLEKAKKLGANIPQVIDWTKDSILMEFIGDSHVAPRLIDIELTSEQAGEAFKLVLKDIKILLKCGVVHSDLSAYNILWWNNKPVIIDLPQAIDIRHNPNKNELLIRDIDNIIKFFEKYIKIDREKIYKEFKKYE